MMSFFSCFSLKILIFSFKCAFTTKCTTAVMCLSRVYVFYMPLSHHRSVRGTILMFTCAKACKMDLWRKFFSHLSL